MRILISLIVSLIFCFNVFAEEVASRTVNTLVNSSEATSIPVVGAADVFTQPFPISHVTTDDNIVIMYKATSSGTISLTLNLQESYNKTTSATTDSTYLTTKVIQAGLSDNAWHMATADTVNGTWSRVHIKGGATNAASTTVQVKVIK